MASYNFMKKKNAMAQAAKMRKMGLNASAYKKKKGYGLSVTRRK